MTSRSRLSGLLIRDGAQRTILETLSEAESVALLTETMAAYRPGDDPADIAELARLCAHLPLALRIAAERAAGRPGMPLGELIADLRDESSLWDALSTGDDDEAEAVRTVFAWSYRALPEHAARLFCLLGLHPGGDFSEAAAAVLADPGEERVRACLDVLAGAYLLEQRSPGRYQFHDLLRAYAVARAGYEVSQQDQLAAVERMCSWYLHGAYQCALSLAHDTTLLFELEPPPGIPAPAFRDREQAARWYAEEKANLLGAVRAAAETDRRELTYRLAVVLERIYATYNHFQDWRVTSELGLEAARALGHREGEAVLCESIGRLCRMTLQLDEAARYHRAAMEIHRELGDRLSTVKALNGLGWVELFAHRPARARAGLEEALPIIQDLGDPYWTATVRYSLGYALTQLELFDEAEPVLARSLEAYRDMGDHRLYESMVLTAFSLLARRRGQSARALATAEDAVAIARDMENPLWEGTALLYLGKAQLAEGRPEDALVTTQRAAVMFRKEGDPSREAMALDGTGRAYRALGRLPEAADFHRRAATVHGRLGDRWKRAKSLVRLADALAAGGERGEAAPYLNEAQAIFADYDDARSVALRAEAAAATAGPDPGGGSSRSSE